MILFIYLFWLSLFSAWEETQQLIQRGNWIKEDYRIPIWQTDWNGNWKLFDSHHVAFGAFILIISIKESLSSFNDLQLFSSDLISWLSFFGSFQIILFVLFVYGFFFYLRNIWMHIVFRKEPLWRYLHFNLSIEQIKKFLKEL